jgi:DNA anti-recombination protein RmuC
MKTRIVIWGTNESDEKLLIAIGLNAPENKVDIYTFPENLATEVFYNLMMNQWREGMDIEFPEGYGHINRPLNMSESLLPENLKVERTDLIQRAQTEWHFVVLSSKLYQSFKDEVSELKEKVARLDSFDPKVWDELRDFWGKVQGHINDKNLFRDHARKLKENVNELFSNLKQFRKSMDDEFKAKSKEHASAFFEKLQNIEERISAGLGLQPIFNELKDIQKDYRDAKFTREDRKKVWDRLDLAFKKVKEKKYGPGKEGQSNALVRLKRRYDGLLSAIEKMQRSIHRDRNDLEFQGQKIADSDGQLEAQIRQAKVKMIEERIRSKEEKLADMDRTKEELERKISKEEAREVKRQKEAEKEKVKETIKEKIAEEMKEAAEAREGDAEKLEKAAEEISSAFSGKKEAKKEKDSIMDTLSNTLGESLQDVGDTIKAVAMVVGDKIEDALEGDDDKVAATEKPADAETTNQMVTDETGSKEEE